MPKDPNNIKLSILILSIPSRLEIFLPLLNKLSTQIGESDEVEILSLLDNKSLHIFEKRNELMNIARGSHLTFLDDDDDISEDYIKKIIKAISSNPDTDVISFNQQCYLDGLEAQVFAKMGNPHEDVRINPLTGKYKDTLRPPYHWCVWKSSLARSESFKGIYSSGDSGQSMEDIDWLKRLYPKVSSSIYLENDALHIYRFCSRSTESILTKGNKI
tara:strand:+ start:11555 stop:12202 length:648 start_codon:yes stop_codon:yes gene_type:complete